MSQGAVGSDLTFPYADREGKLTGLGNCMCNPLPCPRDLHGPRKGLSGAVMVAVQ